MKFLPKQSDSEILKNGLVYKGQSASDRILRDKLLKEQFGFCAYTERKLLNTDATHIEHFDPTLKYSSADDYYNYYAVLSWANYAKLKKNYTGSRFFQIKEQLYSRIKYEGGEYKPCDPTDSEALDLIEFLSFNAHDLYEDRKKHLDRLKETKQYIPDLQSFIRDNPEDLSFPTAIEAEFNISLDDIIAKLPPTPSK